MTLRLLPRRVTGFLIPLLVVVSLATVPVTAEGDPVHKFDCGPDAAPSGPYLNVHLLRVFHYDCLTGALVPGAEFDSRSLCQSETDETGRMTPMVGFCAFAEEVSSTQYEATFFAAVVGWYEGGAGFTHIQGETEHLLDCGDTAPECRPLNGRIPELGLVGLGVTYLNKVQLDELSCGSGPVAVESHLSSWGPSGSVTGMHDSVANLCA